MSRSRVARRALDASVSARDRRSARRRGQRRDGEPGPLFVPSRRALTSHPDGGTIPQPNLLDSEPRLTLDAGEVVAALDFAFAGGSCAELSSRFTYGALLPDSDFEPESFARDLFVAELVRDGMRVEIDGFRPDLHEDFITRVLSQPPSDPRVSTFRREVLSELAAEPRLRRGLNELYRSLATLWRIFGEPASTSRYEATRRRIDALAIIRGVIESCRATFAGATSGLSRIAEYAERVAETDACARLVEVLDYENDMAKIDVRMQVGVDGRVRRFQILRLAESEDNRFYATPVGRWLGKLLMWWRGYKFSDDELVDRWLDQVFEGVSPYLPSLLMLSSHIELYLASLALYDRCAAKGLKMCLPELAPAGEGARRVTGLFNPLLLAEHVVPKPCDLSSGGAAITILTGPNSGGKTRLLQAIGLAQLLAQGGFFAPLASGTIPVATGMFVSVIAEHTAADREGRLGTELIRIRRLFEKARGGALVILDELCSGTNPSEGEEIFYLVLRLLAELGPEAFITTHFLSFARRLEAGGGPPEGESSAERLPLSFLQVELDSHQRPTYGFEPGVATTSLAAQTAARLGVTREELMTLVRQNRAPRTGEKN